MPAVPAGRSETDLIVAAALEAFARQGYNGTTTRHIARTINRSAAVIYGHFPSKRALLFHIISSAHEALRDELEKAVDEATDSIDCVRRLVMSHVVFHAEHCAAGRVANYELYNLAPHELDSVLQLRRHMENLLREAILKGTEEKVFHVEDTDLVSGAIMSIGIDVSRWYRTGRRLTPVELAERYVGYVLDMLNARNGNT